MASLKQLDERRYKITVSNGYRPDGRKVCKARTLHVPKRIPRRSVLQYVMHAAEEVEKEFKYGYAEDGEKRHLRRMHADGWKGRRITRQYARRVPADAGDGCMERSDRSV